MSSNSEFSRIAGRNTHQTLLRACLTSASVVSIIAGLSTSAFAQGEGEQLETIVVTGSRITANGFQAPTPTSIISAADIEKNAQPNIFATITQLPSLQGSAGVQNNTYSTSSGTQGLSSFSLRGLGTIRTLTLLDGQRVRLVAMPLASNATGGVVDVASAATVEVRCTGAAASSARRTFPDGSIPCRRKIPNASSDRVGSGAVGPEPIASRGSPMTRLRVDSTSRERNARCTLSTTIARLHAEHFWPL